MVLTYFVQGEPLTYNILFPSYDACSYSKGAMYAITRPHLDDVHIYCKGTHHASNELVKPMPRPWHNKNKTLKLYLLLYVRFKKADLLGIGLLSSMDMETSVSINADWGFYFKLTIYKFS